MDKNENIVFSECHHCGEIKSVIIVSYVVVQRIIVTKFPVQICWQCLDYLRDELGDLFDG